MRVFISWSGPQSKHIARALRGWLCDVIQSLDPWMSELDIGAGQRWTVELWRELQDSHFGVVCLTAENLKAPWLHYEAGALAKTVEGRVCPYLYEIEPSVVEGPLSHLQMKQADEQGTKELVQSINTVIKDLNEKDLLPNEKSLSPEQLNKAFNRCWPELEKALNVVPPSTAAAPPQRDMKEMVEELLEIGRSLAREAISAKEGKRAREDASANEEKRMRILKRVVEPTRSDVIEKIVEDRLKIIEDRLVAIVVANLEPSISEEPLPPSDPPQEEKLPSK